MEYDTWNYVQQRQTGRVSFDEQYDIMSNAHAMLLWGFNYADEFPGKSPVRIKMFGMFFGGLPAQLF